MKRHRDAIGIQGGARNVRAIARSLVEASDEAACEGIGAEHDAAVRMIVHRLAKLCDVDEIDYGYDAATLRDVYCLLMAECENRAKEIPIEASGSEVRPEAERTELQIPEAFAKDPSPVALVMPGAVPSGDEVAQPQLVEEAARRSGFFGLLRFKGDN